MDEKQIIRQLKTFSQIQPDKGWALSLKQRLLTQDLPVEATEKTRFIFTGLVDIFSQPRMAFASLAVLGAVVIGVSFYFDWFGLFQNQQSKTMVVALQTMEGQLQTVNQSLDGLKTTAKVNQALSMTEVIKSTIKNNQQVAKKLQASPMVLSRSVLAGLSDVNKASNEVMTKTDQVQKEILEKCLADLKQRSLSAADQERLSQAEKFYNQGNVSEAILLLQQIGQ
ncbi:hypothetical protein COZ78_02980 [bacterium (Candidatus Gribaldobacteria) CG_4_8_14_3_um_filter_42_11]|uniref:DUF5667 domain-containing protein n=1 Tax=bacterium (Candidatus Gribaldobacteria) CG_4_8_14_3_um_filter_42_11 TaxID=2014267 RepID=A0A2M7IXR1_9BACT|nr:MAG: hypothetical protein COZ78_02980 [bacterium (Candidatus Gribaldobacteria) CG_4_8_14_3_um_filter_42_11]